MTPRRIQSAALAAGAFALAVASTLAAAPPSASLRASGGYAIRATAAKGTIKVQGSGRFTLTDDGKVLTFKSEVGLGKPHLDMGERQNHTRKEFGLNRTSVLTLSVPKSQLSFPEAGKKQGGVAKGKVRFAAGEQPVDVTYSVTGTADGYLVEFAEFTFNYVLHHPKKEQICLALICVAETVSVRADNVKISAH